LDQGSKLKRRDALQFCSVAARQRRWSACKAANRLPAAALGLGLME
jgi:hypothetical protein